MQDRKLELIAQLMEELQEYMEPSADELSERLGRGKGLEVAKVEIESPELEEKEEMLGEDLDGDMEMGESPEHMSAVMGPDESLKKRIMKLRG